MGCGYLEVFSPFCHPKVTSLGRFFLIFSLETWLFPFFLETWLLEPFQCCLFPSCLMRPLFPIVMEDSFISCRLSDLKYLLFLFIILVVHILQQLPKKSCLEKKTLGMLYVLKCPIPASFCLVPDGIPDLKFFFLSIFKSYSLTFPVAMKTPCLFFIYFLVSMYIFFLLKIFGVASSCVI